METLCKTCCNGACPLQVTKDRLIISCIEYIPGMMIGEIADRLKENELANKAKPVKHGRWIPQSDDMWLCSNCKENIIYSCHESDRTEKQRYCCRCGARMIKDGDAE